MTHGTISSTTLDYSSDRRQPQAGVEEPGVGLEEAVILAALPAVNGCSGAAQGSWWRVFHHPGMQHAFGIEVPESVAEMCQRRRAALLVHDAKVGILAHVVAL